ncbi:SGNH/GDSL hydrolase family protein [Mesorhizobium sp.]|uniref:SGNH/GDSL hydrolase family protein n=1 Tax=Mesorhizobium sp. TaxID=1871066 RepID=UPI00257FDB01|nr:SGNH/GDSL hydrolase family protein [Mesorhizobium sp.]
MTTNVDIATAMENGDTLDALTLATGDRVALTGQTAPAQNGVWVVQASGTAIRATDMDTESELIGARFDVDAGTHAAETWSVQTLAPIAVGTTAISIVKTTSSNATTAEVQAARGGQPSLGTRLDNLESSTDLIGSVNIGKVPAVVTASLLPSAFVIVGPVTEDRAVDRIHFAGAAGTLVLYAASRDGLTNNYTPLRVKQYAVAAGVNDISGDNFNVNAGEYLIGYANQGIYRNTAAPGFSNTFLVSPVSIKQVSAATVIAGHRPEIGFELIGRVAADEEADAIVAIDVGRPMANLAASTAWSGTVWVAPDEPSLVDGRVTKVRVHGTNAGTLSLYVATKNADGTFTTAASSSHAVAAGTVEVDTDLPIAVGQEIIFRHTGIVHYQSGAGGLRFAYLGSAPTTNSAITSHITGSNLMFGATIEGEVRGLATSTDRRVTVLEGGSNPWSGRKVAFLGTSITAGDAWVGAVAAELGMTATDLGFGGGTVTAWNPGGGTVGGQIISQIASIPTDASLVLLEGFVNDIWQSGGAPLGVYTDKVQGTFYGALWAAYTAIKARAPNALIVCLCDWGDSTNPAGTAQEEQDLNAQSLSPWHYREAYRISANMAGLPFLLLGGMGFGYFTPEFYTDHIHQNVAGNARIPTWVAPFIRLLRPIS